MTCCYCGHDTTDNDTCPHCGMCPRCGHLGTSIRHLEAHRLGEPPRHAHGPVPLYWWREQEEEIRREWRSGGHIRAREDQYRLAPAQERG